MYPPINIFDFKRAILHIDGDCFFASCEIAKNPQLKGKPVITGMERGIVSSLTYEAKALGIKRAMSLQEVKKICPQAILLPSDYETYSLYSMRMFNIVKRFTSDVEEYSIDECFADLTGLRRPLNMSYPQIAAKIKQQLDNELGMTFSLGLAPTKVLAKIGSKWKKPSGLTVIPGRQIHQFLQKTTVDQVWGIGPQTTAYLNKLGVKTCLQFVYKEKEWVMRNLTKPHQEIWQELKGNMVYDLTIGQKQSYQSISKTKTFTPPSSDKSLIFSQLSKNMENACIKARRHILAAQKLFFFLKTQDFRIHGLELKLNRPSAIPNELLQLISKHYNSIFNDRQLYRATGVILINLIEDNNKQLDLFGQALRGEKLTRIFSSCDEVDKKYGKHSLFLGSSFKAMTTPQHYGGRDSRVKRQKELFKGEDKRKRIGLPMLGSV